MVTAAPAQAATIEPAVDGSLVGGGPTTGPPFASRPFSARTRRLSTVLMIVLAVVALVEAGAFLGTYFLYSRYHVVTDNAIVDADAIDVNAPTSGIISRWSGNQGAAMRPGQSLGRVVPPGEGPRPQFVVKAPANGVIGINDAVDGEYVRAGQTMAIAYDLRNIWITARIDQSEIGRVRVGQPVDIGIDGFSGIPMTGTVILIQRSTAGQFDIYPSTDTDPTNIQKVDQYVPVRVVPTYTGGQRLVPGMNATVRIHTPR
jgi:multidrug resistance efflux pump